ncbi:hypothetical protein A2Z33_06515 [Candidatus Gottesmanbacteria bacterium RBG_16_52_11]|uniref:YprB ribonuclease H-like domain-containing protein n=1 Tax=Candidatus Gottesmanbacteria bacterium RBG_16_52_11 TaxID=1798374 RepID=A0A1F5YYE9_9BACT|nr:MAG: hypothetical protein A2Z33_06515 [Candidatus Gottesmanbacteria bacterium RBG_16_52_11]
MVSEVFFDVETQRLFADIESDDPGKLGISVVSVLTRTGDPDGNIKETMRSFWENELSGMWQLFTPADRIIGFNSLSFDIPALSPYSPPAFSKLPHFDIFARVRDATGKKLGLATLARDTLGRDKSDIGTNAVMYWNRKDPASLEKLRKYCEADVYLTRDLYDYGFRNRKLMYRDKWNEIRTFEVDFSYPRPDPGDPGTQMGLF